MTVLESIILGIIQGLTEFLPISSSGHLQLAQIFLGLKNLEQYIVFDLICHLGTLCAIIFFFSKRIKEIILRDKTWLGIIFLGTLPLFPLVFLLKPLKSLFDQPQYLGFFFLLTSLLLFLGTQFGSDLEKETLYKKRWRDSLFIGLFQAIAVLPGISRSGSTISGARLLGWKMEDAIIFSFLLAIPAILGATLLEFVQIWMHPSLEAPSIEYIHYLTAFLTSMGVGCFSLWLMQRLAAKQKFIYFVWYCLALGIFTTLYFNFVEG